MLRQSGIPDDLSWVFSSRYALAILLLSQLFNTSSALALKCSEVFLISHNSLSEDAHKGPLLSSVEPQLIRIQSRIANAIRSRPGEIAALTALNQELSALAARALESLKDEPHSPEKQTALLGSIGALLFFDATFLENSRQQQLIKQWKSFVQEEARRKNLIWSSQYLSPAELLHSLLLPFHVERRKVIWLELGLTYLPGRTNQELHSWLLARVRDQEPTSRLSFEKVKDALSRGIHIELQSHPERIEPFYQMLLSNQRPVAVDFESGQFDGITNATAHDIFTHDVGFNGHLTFVPPVSLTPEESLFLGSIEVWLKEIEKTSALSAKSRPLSRVTLKNAFVSTVQWMLFETPENAKVWINALKHERIHPRVFVGITDSLTRLGMERRSDFRDLPPLELFSAMLEASPKVLEALKQKE